MYKAGILSSQMNQNYTSIAKTYLLCNTIGYLDCRPKFMNTKPANSADKNVFRMQVQMQVTKVPPCVKRFDSFSYWASSLEKILSHPTNNCAKHRAMSLLSPSNRKKKHDEGLAKNWSFRYRQICRVIFDHIPRILTPVMDRPPV